MKKTFFVSVILLMISTFSFGQIRLKIPTPVFNPTKGFVLPASLSGNADVKATDFSKRILRSGNIHELSQREIYVENDSVFLVNYFYTDDSLHPVRVGSGFVGMKKDFPVLLNGNDKVKFGFK